MIKIICTFLIILCSNMSTIDDQLKIITEIQNNNEGVLKELYVRNFHKVERFVLQNSGTKSQAKDIYQETFIALWKNIQANKFIPENPTAIDGYIYQIARNKWRDYLRSAHFKRTSSLETHSLGLQKDEEKMDASNQDEKLEITEKAFKSLGNACKEILKEFYYRNKSMREIANDLGIDEASARNKKYRCIQKLKEFAQSFKP